MDLAERAQLTRWVTTQLLVTLAQSLVVALGIRWVLLGYGRTVGLAAAWAISLVAVGALRLQRLALPGTGARRRRRVARDSVTAARGEMAVNTVLGRTANEPVAPLAETLDRRFRRFARHADRVTYAVVANRHYESGVRPVLRELAADGLRRHHGVDLTAEPEPARDLLGDDLWLALTADRSRPPTTAELDRWVTALEQLADARSTSTPRPRTTPWLRAP